MNILGLLLLGLCTLWTVLGLFAVRRVTNRKPRQLRVTRQKLPAVTVLKPLCGADPGLGANLTSFFTQDYPDYELIFGVQSPSDPAIEIVRSLQRRYPQVRSKLAVHRKSTGINPKVRNLRGMVPQATHDLLLISDSNVRAPKRYIREMVQTLLAEPGTGLVTNVFAGTDETSVGSALENVQLNGFCVAGTALPTILGDACVVGKSMLFSRRCFARLGGFNRVADVLAEDFVIGKMFQHGGYQVAIAPTVLANVTSALPFSAFIRRHLRWSMLRLRLRPVAYLLEPVTSPLALLPIAWMFFGPVALLWTAALLLLRDVGGWFALRGSERVWLAALLSPLRELCILAVWLYTPFKRHIRWRENRVRVGAGTLLFAPNQ